MDISKNGGGNDSDSVSTASPLLKPDTSSRLQKAKESALESMSRIRALRANVTGQFIVAIKSDNSSKGVARMLTEAEIEDLRKTKYAVAKRIKEALE